MSGGFVIVCGGTGGHLAPGIALAQRLQSRGEEVSLIVSRKGIDRQLSNQYSNFRFISCPGDPFSLRPMSFIKFLRGSISGLLFSIRYLRKERPKALIAFGGFLSIGFAITGSFFEIPLFLHEANRVPGRSIRLLSRFASRVYLPEGVRIPSLPLECRRTLGMPLREEVSHIPKDEIRKRMNMPRHSKVLVVMGGSQGAQALNDWVAKNFSSLLRDGIWVFCVTGPGKNQNLTDVNLKDDNGEMASLKVFPFHERPYELFSSADVVLSRAGAGTIAEIISCICPSILVPYPFAADNHQEANARDLERRGGCVMINQNSLDTLYREVMDLIFNDWLLGKMRENLRRLNQEDAAEELVSDVERTLYGKRFQQPVDWETPKSLHS